MTGQFFYLFLRDLSLAVPCFFTGGIACAYLSLPFLAEAKKVLHLERQPMSMGRVTEMEHARYSKVC
jgi:hypothetical protein